MSKATRHTFILAISVLLFALFFYGGLWHLVDKKRALAGLRATERMTLSTKQLEVATLKSTLVETSKDRAALGELIVTDDRLTEFLALVESGARAQGLRATTRSVDIVKPQGPFEELRVVLDVEGSYEGLRRLVMLIEVMPFHVDIEDISFDRREGSEWHGIITFSVTKERIQ